jgi:hypothetical protein
VRRLSFLGAGCLLLLSISLFGGVALAHEPCSPDPCLSPQRGEPGTRVEVQFSTWKVVWNAAQNSIPAGYPHHPDQPSIVLVEADDRMLRNDIVFQIPDVPPGTYAVAFYEVSENYQHYRWDQLTVTGSASQWPQLVLAGLGAVALTAIAVLMVNRSRRTPTDGRHL